MGAAVAADCCSQCCWCRHANWLAPQHIVRPEHSVCAVHSGTMGLFGQLSYRHLSTECADAEVFSLTPES